MGSRELAFARFEVSVEVSVATCVLRVRRSHGPDVVTLIAVPARQFDRGKQLGTNLVQHAISLAF